MPTTKVNRSERGYMIHEVALFTLHESWQELQRYTHLRPSQVALR